MKKPVQIKKYSGENVDFERSKLIRSLMNSGADESLADQIAKEVEERLFEGISTRKIYQMAFKRLKKTRRTSATRYKIKKAIMELGPSGFPFEQFVSRIFVHDGYKTDTGTVMQGNCVSHEIDVIARKDSKFYIAECKYHNTQKKVSDVKIPLYINSRFEDIMNRIKAENGDGHEYKGWIFTNTRFTSDARVYARCVGLQLVSWDYPEGKSLRDRIRDTRLLPITALTTLTRREKNEILNRGIVLCEELYEKKAVLTDIGVARTRLSKVLEDLEELCTTDL
jgi:hypothetical protein